MSKWSELLADIESAQQEYNHAQSRLREANLAYYKAKWGERKTMSLLERFMQHVEKTDNCWLWTASKDGTGYGRFLIGRKSRKANRVAYQLCVGPIPSGMHVCHHCDNPACVRPDHLFLGTHLDNMRDMMRKGRDGRRKLTWAQVQRIRSMVTLKRGALSDLAREFSVSTAVISSIRHNRRYKYQQP